MEPVVADAGYDLEAINVSPAGRRQVVRVVVDADDGITLDDVATVASRISAALDSVEWGSAPYTLEVTSPGVDRPLTQPRHWQRNVGRLVQVRMAEAEVTGRLLAADAEGVTLELAGEKRQAGYGELGPGAVQVEFNRKET